MKRRTDQPARPDRERVDLQLFFSPFGQEFVAPELGVPQLTAYLTGRGLRVRQTDLNLLGLGPATALCGREAPRFWQPPPRRGARLWNRGGYAYPLDEVLEAVAGANPETEILHERFVRERAGQAGLVGFSVCTADQAVAALFLCRRIREDFPRLKTCLGGPWVGASWDALP
ncbi:MAG: hypothetical protein HZB91_01805, partial [Elusimicrobia bacterium]|nr:hypothetical protein [Elusimicrobiota bacterium]